MVHVGGENIESQTGKLLNLRTAGEQGLISGKYLFDERDVLYSKIRPALNKVAAPAFERICSADMYPLRPLNGKLCRQYLVHLLRSTDFLEYTATCSSRTNIPKINRDALFAYQTLLPPVKEQQRIAAILGKADAIRRNREEGIRLTEELLRSTFLDMFGDPKANNKRWEVQPFHQVCDTRLGKMLDAKRQTGRHSRPYMRNFNVQWGRVDLSSVLEMDFEPSERDEFRLCPGDVLICEGGAGVGQTAVWRGEIPECYFQKSLHRVRPLSGTATSGYIAHLMRELMRSGGILDAITSATIPHLTGEKLKAVRIPLPPMHLQQRFGEVVESIRQVKSQKEAAIKESNMLFDSLVQRAFRGEL
jgi:type I restriction enzyme S subunit